MVKKPTYEELEQEVNLLRLTCDNVPDLIWSKDLEGRFLFVNQTMCDKLIMCDSPDKALGKTDMFFAEQQRKSGYEHTFGESCVDSDSIIKGTKVRGRFLEDGLVSNKYLALDVHKAPFLNKDGEMIGTVGCGRDVTKERETEKALWKSEERYRSLVESTDDSIYLVAEDLTYLFMNRSHLSKYGGKREKVIGRNYADFHSENETRDFANRVQTIFDTGRSLSYEYQSERNGGYYLRSLNPVKNSGGETKAVTVVSRDVTERKRAEEKMRESEHKYRTLIENFPDFIARFDEEGRHLYVNPSITKAMDIPLEQIVGKTIRELPNAGSPEQIEALITKVKEVFEHGIPNRFEASWMTQEGERFFDVRHIPELDQHGKVVSVLGITRDITERKQAEEALLKKEATNRFHSQLLHAVCQAVIATDLEGRVIYWNAFAEKLFGWSYKEVLGKTTIELIATEFSAEQGEKIMEELRKGKNWSGEYLCRHRNGTEIPVLVTTSPIYGDSGNLSGIIGVSIDISERKHAEEALRESENNFRTVVENANDGLLIASSTGDHLFANKRASEITGYSVEELLKIRMDELAHPDEIPKLIETLKKRIKGEEIPGQYETAIMHKEGKTVPIEITGAMTFWQSQVADIVIFRDITERKRTEEALRESEKRFRDLSEMLPEIAFETDADMNLSFASKQAFTLFGYSQQEFEDGINALDLLVSEDKERAVDNITKRFRGESFGAIEYRALRKDGSSFPILLHATPIIDQGITKGLRGIIVDLSERKLIEEQLQQSQKMEALGTLSGGIAHEFNNILGIIIGNTELADDDVPEWNPAKDCLEEIRTASLRAKDVVRQIMSFSRKTPAIRKPVRISTIIHESLKLIRATIPANIDIRQEILCKDEMILANPTEINQILMNLCTNSVHAMEEETGILKVRLETTVLENRSAAQYNGLTSGEYVKLTVKDNGSGIAPKIKGLIFDPYFTTKDVGKGLGMGLAIVYGIVKKHDGAIRVNSKVRKGTTVVVLFPVIKETAQIEKEISKDLPRGTERILFVDDEASLVKTIVQMLERQGYEVVGKTSSTEALQLFQEESEKFDLIITDMAMPDMTGDRLAQELIKIRPTIPVIICTGHSDRMDEGKAMKSGIAAYAMKPLVRTDLVNTVRRVLDKSKDSTQ